jgi:hypothetical protein
MANIHTESIQDGVFVFEMENINTHDIELYNPAYFRAIGFPDAEISLVVKSNETQMGGGEEDTAKRVIYSPYEVFVYLFGSKSDTGDKNEMSWYQYINNIVSKYRTTTNTENTGVVKGHEGDTVTGVVKGPEGDKPLVKGHEGDKPLVKGPEVNHTIDLTNEKVPGESQSRVWKVKIPVIHPDNLINELCVLEKAEIESRQLIRQINYEYKMKGKVYSIGSRHIVLGEVVPITDTLEDNIHYPHGTIMHKVRDYLH